MSVQHIKSEPEFRWVTAVTESVPKTWPDVLKSAWGNLVSDFRAMYFDIKPKPKVMPPPEVVRQPRDLSQEKVGMLLP